MTMTDLTQGHLNLVKNVNEKFSYENVSSANLFGTIFAKSNENALKFTCLQTWKNFSGPLN